MAMIPTGAGAGTPPDANAQPDQNSQPTATNTPQPIAQSTQPTPTGAPSPAAAPNASAPTPAAQPPKKHFFDRVLESMAGGPTIVNGVEQPMSRKSLTAHILAGAITGIVQGASKGYQQPIGPGGSRAAQNAAALSGGFDATGAAMKAIANKPQEQQDKLDAAKLKDYNTFDRNLKLHQAMLSGGSADRAAQDSMDKPGVAMVAAADDYTASNPELPPAIADRGLTGDEAMKKYPQLHKQNFIMMGHRDMLNPDGSQKTDPKTGLPMREPLFAVINPDAKFNLTPEVKDQFGKMNPDVKRIPENTPIGMQAFLDMHTNQINFSTVEGGMKSGAQAIEAITGQKVDDQDFKKKIQSDPVLRKNAATIARYMHGRDPDEVVDFMAKDKVDPNVISHFSAAMGLDQRDKNGESVAQKLALHRQNVLQDQKDAEEERKRVADDVERRRLARSEKEDALNIKNRVLDPPTSNTTHFANEWTDPKTGMNYDLTHPSVKIVEGTEDPSQLTKRAVGNAGYDATIRAADAYSYAKYGQPFDMARATVDYSYAKAAKTQDTLKLVQALTGEDNKNVGGSLTQLQDQLKTLGNTPIPKMNDLKNWASKNAGQPGVTNFNSTMLGVADEMGRILGGGVATDSSRAEANAIIDKSFSENQGEGAIKAIRGLFANRFNAVVGNNRYLNHQYGKMQNPMAVTQGAPNQAKVAPPGKFAAKDAQGNVIGYADDNKGTNFVKF